ncbi:MAG: winged helix-turn-helix domain-containing protein, partial [Dysosmobacter sp.]
LLCLLLRNPGTVFSREQLISQVWGYEFTGETRTVDVHIRTLRQKLGKCGECVETVRGYGYKIGE